MSKTLILSDIHYSNRGSNVRCVEQLRPLWDGFDALVFNGDTAELHSTNLKERSRIAIEKIKQCTKEDGVELALLCGNHDPTISELQHLWFHDNKTLVFHGHAPIRGLAPWSWRYKHIVKNINDYIEKAGDGFHEQLAAAREASITAATGGFNQHRPNLFHMLMLSAPASFQVLRCWWKYPSDIATWVSRYAPSAKYVITGHTHHAGVWQRGAITILNTGCYGFPSHPRAVVLDGDSIAIHKVRKRNNRYCLGGVCESWNAL
ncbi:MAG: metallophosphoesterase family protein [Planctomycetes bacterium]|nr:metallophosphoesterase family protein [Planctomycetota bacterium]